MAKVQLKNPRKFIVVFICLVLTFVIVFVGLPKLNSREEALIDIVKVRDVVPANTLIEDSLLKMVSVGKYNLPSDVVLDKNDIIGKYSSTDILPSDVLVPGKFQDAEDKVDAFLYEYLEDGRVNVSVTAPNLASVLSGKLRGGDIVEVLVYKKGDINYETGSSGGGQVITYNELKYLEVASVTNNRTEDVAVVEKKIAEGDNASTSNVNIVPSTVVLRCYPEQAKKLVEAEYTGSIHLVFVYRGDEKKELLNEQRKILGMDIESTAVGGAGNTVEGGEEEASVNDSPDTSSTDSNASSNDATGTGNMVVDFDSLPVN